MLYRVIGIMSGSSLDGLDIAFVEFEESAVNGVMKSKQQSAILTMRNGVNNLKMLLIFLLMNIFCCTQPTENILVNR